MKQLTIEELSQIDEAIKTIEAYKDLELAADPVTVQKFRDDFAEHKRVIGQLHALYEYKKNGAEFNRRISGAKKYLHYRKEGNYKGDRMTGNEIESQVLLDVKELKEKEMEFQFLFRKVTNLYNSLGDYQNTAASKIKIEE